MMTIAFIVTHLNDKVLVEYGVMTAADREKYVMLDAQTRACLMCWQGAATHHLRKFNVIDQPPMSSWPTQAYQKHTLPCTFARRRMQGQKLCLH